MISLNIFKTIQLNGIPNILCKRALSAISSSVTLRFIQFKRQNNPCYKLGIVSEDGSCFMDLSGQCMFPPKFVSFLKSNYCLDELHKSLKLLRSECVSDNIKLFAPIINPEKVLAINLSKKLSNNLDNCNQSRTLRPIIVNKLPTSLIGPTENVILPRGITEVSCQTELAIVIGKEAKHVSLVNAMDHIFGYTIAQNLTAIKFSDDTISDDQPLIVSSIDTFCPLGPTVVHKSLILNPHNLMTACSVNGKQIQCENTNGLMFNVNEIIHFITQFVTLTPGDVILTGPPNGIGMFHRCGSIAVKAGDTVESEIETIGKLRNTVFLENGK